MAIPPDARAAARQPDREACPPVVASPAPQRALSGSLLAQITGEAPPVERRLFSALLGVIAIKDLMVNDVPRMLLARPDELRLPFFSFTKPLLYCAPGDAACYAIHVAAFGCALLLVAGRFARLAAALLASLYLTTFLTDQLAYTNNVFLFVVLLALCAIEPLDPERAAPRYPTFLARALLTVIYAVGALVKLDPLWRSGFIFGQACLHYHFGRASTFGLDAGWIARLLAMGSLLLEGLLAIALWRRKLRRYAIALGVLFHLCIELVLPVRLFSWEMMAAYVLFLDRAELDRVHRWWSDRGTLSRALLGALVAVAINCAFTWLFHISALPPRSRLALAIATTCFAAAWALSPGLRRPGLRWDDRAGVVVTPARARLPLVIALAALELFAVVKPAFGYTNRFGWRMFTEVLRARLDVAALGASGWQPSPVDGYWSGCGEGLGYHWDSLGEQRNLVRAYGVWLLAQHPEHRAVRLTMTYARNGGGEQAETIELRRR